MDYSNGPSLFSFQQQLKAVGLDMGHIRNSSNNTACHSQGNPFKKPSRNQRSIQAIFFDSLFSKMPQEDETQMNKFQSFPIQQQILQFCEYEKLSKKQFSIRFQIAFDIMTLLRQNGYPNCLVYIFGSLLTGVADQDSDIDIFIDVNGDDGQSLQQKLSETGGDLEKMGELKKIQQNIYEIIRSSKCPHSSKNKFSKNVKCCGIHVLFVRMVHFQSKIQADLSFTNILSLQNSRLQLFYLTKFRPEILKPFILILRRWTKYHAITGGQDYNNLKNFTLLLLALTFLMERNVIPSVKLLQELVPPLKIDKWNGAFCDNLTVIQQRFNGSAGEISRMELLADFFKWIGETDFEKCVISPFLGRVVDKVTFLREENLGDSFDEHVIIPPRGRFTEEKRVQRVLFLQDPFCQDYNVGVNTSTVAMEKLKEAAKQTVSSYPWKSFIDLFIVMEMTPLEMEKKEMEMEVANGILLGKEIWKALFGESKPFSRKKYSVSAFLLDYKFKHSYLKELAQCGISVTGEKAMIGASKLWKLFGEGFLNEFLQNGMKLKVVRFKEQRKEIPSVGGGWHMEMLTDAQRQHFQMNKQRIHPFHIENLKEKIAKLINLEHAKVINNEVVYQVWGIQVNYPFWLGEQERSGHAQVRPARGSRGGRGPKRHQISQNYFHAEGNPVDVQAKVSEKILCDFGKPTFEPFEINMLVKLDARIVSENCVIRPAISILLELEQAEMSETHQMISLEYLTKILQRAFPAYQLYHLTEWIKS